MHLFHNFSQYTKRFCVWTYGSAEPLLGNADLNLYCAGDRFQYRPGYQISWLKIFLAFVQSLPTAAAVTPSNRQQVKLWIKLSLFGAGQSVRTVGCWSSQNFQTVGTWRWQSCRRYAPLACKEWHKKNGNLWKTQQKLKKSKKKNLLTEIKTLQLAF